jgi:glycosyltransferase involved in cell wall biosynthesis
VNGRIAILLKGYPRLSETFIAQEIRALEARGLDVEIQSMRRPTDAKRHPVHAEIRARVSYLPEYLHQEPRRVLAAWRHWRRHPRYRAARALFLSDFARDPTPNRVRRFGQALVLARELDSATARIHAHFLHTPASVARYAATLRDLPWSCSAHAKDIWTTPEWELREKLAGLDFLTVCTAAGRDRLTALADRPSKVTLAYHGLDFARFPAPLAEREPGPRKTILSVGRAVPKKGFEDTIDALARFPASLDWRWRHVGGGPLLPALKRRAERRGIAARVEFLGARAQAELLALYREADLFVLASRAAKDGDRDGLPNVLMEAQSQALACVSTRLSGIPELIEDGRTGVLVAPGDVGALSGAIESLLSDDDRRRRLAHAGFERVRACFSHEAGIEAIHALLTREMRPCASSSTHP